MSQQLSNIEQIEHELSLIKHFYENKNYIHAEFLENNRGYLQENHPAVLTAIDQWLIYKKLLDRLIEDLP